MHPLYEIQTITTKIHHLKSDECEKKKIISLCTLQALRVLTIKDSIMNIYISIEKEILNIKYFQVNILNPVAHLNLQTTTKTSKKNPFCLLGCLCSLKVFCLQFLGIVLTHKEI